MAKGNGILGNLRGSIGDTSWSVYRGVQVSKKRNRTPANPKTTPQMLQRMCMAQATKLGAFFAAFIDHSWQSKRYGGVSRNYFVKRAVESIRLKALQAYGGTDVDELFQPASFPYATMFTVPFSEGSMQPLAYTDGFNGTNPGVELDVNALPDNYVSDGFTAKEMFAALGIPEDGQLTMISVKAVSTQVIDGGYTEGGVQNMYVPGYSALRLRINPASGSYTKLTVEESYDADVLADYGFLVETEGMATGAMLNLSSLQSQDAVRLIYDWDFDTDGGQNAIAYVAVASLYQNKKWLRSSQELRIVDKYPDNFNAALSSWIGSSASLLNTDRLLNYEGLNP